LRIYVESNFILELARGQAQAKPCEAILAGALGGRVELALPSFSVAEPVETIHRHAAERGRIQQALEQDLSLLARTDSYKDEVERLREFTSVLARASESEREALRSTLQRTLECARVLETTAGAIALAAELGTKFGLKLPDAIVCASIRLDLDARPIASSCFVTRDVKDFGNSNLVDEFESLGCRVLFNFGAAVQLARL